MKPYVYKCTHKETKQFYFGYRSCNKLPANQDLGFKYFTSSKYVKPIFKEFDTQILSEFNSKEEAHTYEQSLILEHWNDPLLINRAIFPKIKGSASEKQKESARERMINNNPMKQEHLREAARLRMTGHKHSEETKLKMSNTRKGKKVPLLSRYGSSNPSAKHYVFISPNNEKFDVIGNRKVFCKQHKLGLDSMIKVINGHLESYKGWTAYEVTPASGSCPR